MKVSICQIEPVLGDLSGNTDKIIDNLNISQSDGCEICVFPELSITGYFCGDLFNYENFVEQSNDYFKKILNHSNNLSFDLFIGHINFENERLYNSVYHIKNGEILNIFNKKYLANFGPCYDARHFHIGDLNNRIVNISGKNILILICEEFWQENNYSKFDGQKIDIAIVINTSPFYLNKSIDRIDLCEKYKTINNFIYVNNTGLYDSIICDGNSFCYNKDTGDLYFGKSFDEQNFWVDVFNNKNSLGETFIQKQNYISNINKYENILHACTYSLKKYLKTNGFSKISIALSGGIDSALVYIIAIYAVGVENVFPVFLPSKHTTKQSFDDAINICDLNNQKLEIIDIEPYVENYDNIDFIKDCSNNLTKQNIQSRIRASIIMAHSNENGSIVLTTGNKSEISVGYCTLYGDTCGGFNPIKDLYKTDVFELCKYINNIEYKIPETIINKEPSAELDYNQKDSDYLPDYKILDAILFQFIENKKMPNQIYYLYDKKTVDHVWYLLNKNQFKRTQSAPGPCLSTCDFDNGRIIPICTKF